MILDAMWSALGGAPGHEVRFTGDRVLPSCYRMTDLGAAAFAAAGLALAELLDVPAPVVVDRTLATGWFHRPSRLVVAGPPPTSPFHALSGDFPTADGRWLRFQANYPHLRDAALAALDARPEHVAEIVAAHPADELEAAVVAGGGATRTVEEWSALMAAAAIRGLTRRLNGHGGSQSRLSLAGTAWLLVSSGPNDGPELTLPLDGPFDEDVQVTVRGPVRRLVWPLTVGGVRFGWDRPGDHYGSATPEWVQ